MLFVIFEERIDFETRELRILRINDNEAGKKEVEKQVIERPDATVIRGQELRVIPTHVEGL